MIPVCGAVELVGAAFGHHVNLRACRTGKGGAGVVGIYAKLFETFGGRGNCCSRHARKSYPVVAFSAACGIAAIKHERVLIASRAGYLATSTSSSSPSRC